MPDTKKETKEELLKSFHEQFAENQNHHQSVFIQFISVVFVVIVGYAIIYTNTDANADFFKTTKEKEHIISYAIVHLLASYLLAQIILALLCALTMNIGYGFRRDQHVNYNIRSIYLEETEYKDVFGDKAFNPTNKKFRDYLPEFNLLFVVTIWFIQIILLASILYALTNFTNFQLNLSKHLLKHGIVLVIVILPFLLSLLMYYFYWRKYKHVVKKEEDKEKGIKREAVIDPQQTPN